MIFTRRGILGVLAGLIAAPMIVRTPGLLMPVKPIGLDDEIDQLIGQVGDIARRLTSAAPPEHHVAGDIWFDMTARQLWIYDGVQWQKPTLNEWLDAPAEHRFVDEHLLGPKQGHLGL